MHPTLKWFRSTHLPPALQAVSKLYEDLTQQLVGLTAEGPELDAALRRLLESKDAAVRARILLMERDG